MLTNGADFVPLVQDLIAKFKLQYRLDYENLDSNGMPRLADLWSRGELHLQKFITCDAETMEMKRLALIAARVPHPLLIVGATGTGKEIIAKAQIGSRTGQVKAVNCGGLPRELIEAELFGYLRGAFTGADTTRDGLMTMAADGVMFLDEIGELPIDVQAKLLRCIQENTIRKVGSHKEEAINCKFVFATHRNLADMVKKGLFREDLYARISTLELQIKSLRPDRACDIVPITESLEGGKEFLAKHKDDLLNGRLDLSLNVRSIQQYVTRFAVWGRCQQ